MLNRQIVIVAVVGLFSSAQAGTGKRTGYRALVLLALGLLAPVVSG